MPRHGGANVGAAGLLPALVGWGEKGRRAQGRDPRKHFELHRSSVRSFFTPCYTSVCDLIFQPELCRRVRDAL